jgi:hypothetical protein
MSSPAEQNGATLTARAWLDRVVPYYLETFIDEGGSAVKVVVPFDESALAEARGGLASAASQRGYVVSEVLASETRVHLMQQLFFRIAESVPWIDLAYAVVLHLAKEAGYREPASGEGTLAARLLRDYGDDPQALRAILRPILERAVFKDRAMAKDFRVAMLHLCNAQLTTESTGAETAVVEWLTGKNKSVSAMQSYQIYTMIDRATARHYFESLLHWLRKAYRPGLVVMLDASRITLMRNPKDGAIYYSKAAVLDAYEVLRQFIDSTDRMEGCLFVVLPDKAFLEDDIHAGSRGMAIYQALKFRVIDEIRDRRLANPMAALVRLGNAV